MNHYCSVQGPISFSFHVFKLGTFFSFLKFHRSSKRLPPGREMKRLLRIFTSIHTYITEVLTALLKRQFLNTGCAQSLVD